MVNLIMVQEEENLQVLREQALEYIGSASEDTLKKVISILKPADQYTDLSELPPQIRKKIQDAVTRADNGDGLVPHNTAIKTLRGEWRTR